MPTLSAELNYLRQIMANLDPEGPPQACFVTQPPQLLGHRFGILDASFNPMTLAHARMVEEARKRYALDSVTLILSRSNVDKEVFGADLGQRLSMLIHQTEGDPQTWVAGCSHGRFVDKAHALRSLYPENTYLYFILGYDTLLRLFNPKYYTDMIGELNSLFEACYILVANRDENGLKEMRAILSQPNYRPYADRIYFINLPESFKSLSSTVVRKKRMHGQTISELVPPRIAEAIEILDLYK